LMKSEAGEDLKRLREVLRFSQSGFHCMCLGDLALEITGPEGVLAVLGLHHGVSFRWEQVWKSDARLADPMGLAQFFADHSVTSMRDQQEEDRIRGEEMQRGFEHWWRNAPEGMPPFEQLRDSVGRFSPSGRALAESALRARHVAADEVIRALLLWYGNGRGPWSGYPVYESMAEELLNEYPIAALAQALESTDLTSTQLHGAARLFGGWQFWKGRADDRARIGTELRARLRAEVASRGYPDNLDRFDRAWKT